MKELKNIISEVLGISMEEINDDLTRTKTEEWDSFTHMLLISDIETKLGLKFTMKEVQEITTYRQLEELVIAKRGIK